MIQGRRSPGNRVLRGAKIKKIKAATQSMEVARASTSGKWNITIKSAEDRLFVNVKMSRVEC